MAQCTDVQMKRHLYELLWQVETDILSFIYRELKVLGSDTEARHYGTVRELELNEGASIEERAHDGYYFKYLGADQVKEIDGYKVNVG